MDVILLQRVEKLGYMGQVVNVKSGYARNYLLPQKKALRATKANLEQFEKQRAHLEAANLKHKEEALHAAAQLEGLTVVITRQAGENGHLYGSVNARDIAAAVSQAKAKIERNQVVLNTTVKTLGIHQAKIILHPEVSISINVNVAQSEEEAKLQESRIDKEAKASEPASEMQA